MQTIQSSCRGRRRSLLTAALIASVFLGGCAGQDTEAGDNSARVDPWEPMNRKVHGFNMALDRAALKPLAKGYQKVVPEVARDGIGNFFSNLTTPASALNNLLQGKPGRAANELGRFLFNSSFGLAGFFDVAGHSGMPVYEEDFGQTLAVWGVADGPYVVLPFFGPSTVSETFSLPVDYYTDLWTWYDNSSVRDKAWLIRLLDQRAGLLAADAILEDSQDTYITLRESYLQNREFRIYDGDPPVDEDFYDESLFDELLEEDP